MVKSGLKEDTMSMSTQAQPHVKTHGFRIIAAWPGTLTIFPYFFDTFTFLAVGSFKLLVIQNVSHLECQLIYTIFYDFLEMQL